MHAHCVVPEGMSYSVILAWHQAVMHNGAASEIQDLQRGFIIPGLTHRCAKVAKHCPESAQAWTSGTSPCGPPV